MDALAHRTGTLRSGDVEIFYRGFGQPGGTPVVILHGSSYYDSFDWIGIAEDLSKDREVIAFDARGSGSSTWSPSKDYSHDAHVGDVAALLDHLQWPSAALMGHSRGGAYATLFASLNPDRSKALILVDHCPGIGVSGAGGGPPMAQITGTAPRVFPSVDAVLAATSRQKNPPEGSRARQRLLMFTKPVDGGYILAARDPDYQNPTPLIPGWEATIPPDVDVWRALTMVRAPLLVFRALQSKQYSQESAMRLRQEFPHAEMVELDSGHDMVSTVPGALVTATARFLTEQVDRRLRAGA
jgi:pimeloyl-ACP methyl ester carboxylesterase